MERWERREKKLAATKRKMKVTGRGLLTVIRPVIQRRADEAKRAEAERSKPAQAA